MIVVPLDGSELAERALPFAASLARHNSGGLLLLQVVDSHSAHAAGGGPSRDAADYLALRAAEVAATYSLDVKVAVSSGTAEHGIVEAVSLHHADMVVMSTHGRSGFERILLGGVADYVLHHASVPVLLIPPECLRDWDTPSQPSVAA